MKILTKIKCFFRFCKNSEETKLQTELLDIYKVEPKNTQQSRTIKVKEDFGHEVKETFFIEVQKPKRHWYNNGKTQKLIIEGEETSLPKSWKKGRCK